MQEAELNSLLNMAKYPGMPALESNIARVWIRHEGLGYDKLEFNVRLGNGAEIQPGITGATKRQFEIITQKRADIIAYKGNLVDIVEVKVRMSLSAMGQLQGYQHLWQEDAFRPRVQTLIAVAQIIDPDIRRVLEANFIVPYQITPEVHS
jgi:hypothetical protein